MPASFGFTLAGETGSRIVHCLSVHNGYGINVAGSTNCLVLENATGDNTVDAMIACWHSSQVCFRNNYVFNNWYRKHPDGFQTYRSVDRLNLDGNLFLSVGQGWQCAETQDALVTNNIWAGIHFGNSISCSLRPAVVGEQNLRNTFINNTFFGGAVATGGKSRFLNNIVIPPSMGGTSGGPPLEADYNLFWESSDFAFKWPTPGKKRLARGGFGQYQQATGTQRHSFFSDPKFRNAPVFERHLETVPEPELSRLRLRRGDVNGFKVGDLVEVDLDGVKRVITAISGGALEISPPLARLPEGSLSLIWNWKQNENFDLDLRPASQSVAKGKAKGGGDIGSTIDIPARKRGDLNGDGVRDVPRLPPELKNNPDITTFLRNN